MKRNKDGGYRLPDVIDPERICIQVYVPNNMNHLLAFWAQLEMLGSAMSWANDDAHTALDVAAVWRDVYADARENWLTGGCMVDPCCPEEITNLQEINKNIQAILQLMKNGLTAKIEFNDQAPTNDLRVDCTPEDFDGNPDDDPEQAANREKALCATVARYIDALLYKVALEQNAGSSLKNDIKTIILPLSIPNEFISNLSLAGDVGGLDLGDLSILSSTETTTIDNLICEMIEYLQGKTNTFSNFINSISEGEEPTTPTETRANKVRLMLIQANAVRSNFVSFSKQLESAYDEIVDGLEYDCPCLTPPSCDIELEIVPSADTVGSTFEYLGDDRYRFIQNTLAPGGKYITAIRDVTHRCLLVEPQGAETQNPFAWAVQDCAGDWHSGISSFAPVETMEFAWQNTDPMDTIYKITCVETP